MPRCLLLILLISADRPADAALRPLQEPQDGHDIWLVSEFSLGEPGRFGDSVPRAEEHIVRPFQYRDPIGRKPLAAQPHRVKAIHPRTIATRSPHERREVLHDAATAADHGVRPDPHMLMDTGQSPDDGMVADGDVAG